MKEEQNEGIETVNKEEVVKIKGKKIEGEGKKEVKDKDYTVKPLSLTETYDYAQTIMRLTPIVTLRDGKAMWIYDEDLGYYLPNGDTYVKDLCASNSRSSTPHVASKILFTIEGNTRKTREEFESPAHVINLRNGVYDIWEDRLYPHDPKYYFKYRLDIDYDNTATCDNFIKFLNEMFQDREDIDTIRKWFGYHFLKGNREQKALFICGESGSGRSTLLSILQEFLGKEGYSTHSLQAFCDSDSYAVADLYKKLANIHADMSVANVKDISMFKMLTGGDYVPAREIYKGPFTFRNYAKLTFACNKLPNLNQAIMRDVAFWRRVMVIETIKIYRKLNRGLYLQIIANIFRMDVETYTKFVENNGKLDEETQAKLLKDIPEEDKNLLIDIRNSEGNLTKSLYDTILHRYSKIYEDGKINRLNEIIYDELTKHHRKLDKELQDKLKQELPGIFNWAIQGLYDLIEDKEFEYSKNAKLLWIANMEDTEMTIDRETNEVREKKHPGKQPFDGDTLCPGKK